MNQNKKPMFNWIKIRALWALGKSSYAIAAMPGMPSHAAINKHRIAEAWSRNAESAIQEKAGEIVAGLVAVDDPGCRAKIIDSEAEKRASIEIRHRDEPNHIRKLLYATIKEMQARDHCADPREIKAVAECMAMLHAMERKAFRLDDGKAQQNTAIASITLNIVDPVRHV